MKKTNKFTFIDLFAGIGGIRIGFESNGGKCVFSSEYDKFAQITYEKFFGEKPDFSDILKVDPPGDITQLHPHLIPDHDILTGGFPCQPFSLAGVSKKNSLGKPHGFKDPTQGTLFFNIKEIIDVKRPKAFLLENVKNLRNHDKGRTYNVIIESLKGLGYSVFDRGIDGGNWVPQHRERIYIIGFRNPDSDKKANQNWKIFEFDELKKFQPPKRRKYQLDKILVKNPSRNLMVTPGTWNTLERHKAHHKKAGHGFGYSVISPPFKGKVTRTLSARYHKDGAEILIDEGWERPRRLSPLECSRLMGFPKKYQKYFLDSEINILPVSRTQAYRQFGNSVVVPVIIDLARMIAEKLECAGAV